MKPFSIFQQSLLGAIAVSTLAATEPLTVRLSTAEKHPHMALQHGFNLEIMLPKAFMGFDYAHPGFAEGAAPLQPRVLRFPGGTTANFYDWRTDSYTDATMDKGWAGKHVEMFRQTKKQLGRAAFIRYCKAHGIQPIWVLNVHRETAADMPAWLDTIEKEFGKVERVELGNEPYWDPRAHSNVWRYIELSRPLAEALHKLRPGTIKVAACLAPHGDASDYETKWNLPLMKQAWFFDAVVHHQYDGLPPLLAKADDEAQAAALIHPEARWNEWWEALRPTLKNRPLWLTEWNLGAELAQKQWRDTGAHLLYLSAIVQWLHDHSPGIPLVCYHQLYQEGFGTFVWEPKNKHIVLQAQHHLWQLIARWRTGATHRLSTPGSALTISSLLTSEGKLSLLISNRSQESIELRIEVDGQPWQPTNRTTLQLPSLTERLTDLQLLPSASAEIAPQSVSCWRSD